MFSDCMAKVGFHIESAVEACEGALTYRIKILNSLRNCLNTSVPHPTRPCGSQLSALLIFGVEFSNIVLGLVKRFSLMTWVQSPGCLLWEERINPCIILISQSTGILSGNKSSICADFWTTTFPLWVPFPGGLLIQDPQRWLKQTDLRFSGYLDFVLLCSPPHIIRLDMAGIWLRV